MERDVHSEEPERKMRGYGCAFCETQEDATKDGKGSVSYEKGIDVYLGPYVDGTRTFWVHRDCALWSPEVYEDEQGILRRILKAIRRSKHIKCSSCGKKGASLGCRLSRCPRSYHLPCARECGVQFHDADFLISCPIHGAMRTLASAKRRKIDSKRGQEVGRRSCGIHVDDLRNDPHRSRFLDHVRDSNDTRGKNHMRIAAEMVAEGAVDRAKSSLRLARCAWKLPGSDEDEDIFRDRERERLEIDKKALRDSCMVRKGGPDELHDSWDSLGGLSNAVRVLREAVLLPLLYPNLLEKTPGLKPPRGVLLHGEPGTGKTKAVRALIAACSVADRPIALFARKGADCLGKYHGEAERTLRLLFQVAKEEAPSVIFLDEVDGLVPARPSISCGNHSAQEGEATGEGAQDAIHASVVATLLSLMDGLDDRGDVVVIAATNRPESIDPALRRPGRFDREVYFPLPGERSRRQIIRAITRSWPGTAKPTDALVSRLASCTSDWAGADLAALCSNAVMLAIRRSKPRAPPPPTNPVLKTHLQQEEFTAAKEDLAFSLPFEKTVDMGPNFKLEELVVAPIDWAKALRSSPPPASLRGALPSAVHTGAQDAHGPLSLTLLDTFGEALAKVSQCMKDSGLGWKECDDVGFAKKDSIPIPGVTRERDVPGRFAATPLNANRFFLPAKAPTKGEDKKAELAAEGHFPVRDWTVENSEPVFHGVDSLGILNLHWKARKSLHSRILVTGKGDNGQSVFTAVMLRSILKEQPIMFSLPSLLVEGEGCLETGVVRSLHNLKSRIQQSHSLVLVCPHFDSWACVQIKCDAKGSERILLEESPAWKVFIQCIGQEFTGRLLLVLSTHRDESTLPTGIGRYVLAGHSHAIVSLPSLDQTTSLDLLQTTSASVTSQLLQECKEILSCCKPIHKHLLKEEKIWQIMQSPMQSASQSLRLEEPSKNIPPHFGVSATGNTDCSARGDGRSSKGTTEAIQEYATILQQDHRIQCLQSNGFEIVPVLRSAATGLYGSDLVGFRMAITEKLRQMRKRCIKMSKMGNLRKQCPQAYGVVPALIAALLDEICSWCVQTLALQLACQEDVQAEEENCTIWHCKDEVKGKLFEHLNNSTHKQNYGQKQTPTLSSTSDIGMNSDTWEKLSYQLYNDIAKALHAAFHNALDKCGAVCLHDFICWTESVIVKFRQVAFQMIEK